MSLCLALAGENPDRRLGWHNKSSTLTNYEVIMIKDVIFKTFTYDPTTGIFNRKTNKRKVGWISVSNGKKYLRIKTKVGTYRAHQLAFLFVYGYIPKMIDHINGNGLDNRICNLREATFDDNAKNKKVYSNSKTLISGVTFKKDSKKWISRINHEEKRLTLGMFDDFFEACCARKSAELKYGYHANHGSIREL